MDSREQLESNLKNERHRTTSETYYWHDQYKMLAIKMAEEIKELKASREALLVELPKKYVIDGVPVVTVAELKFRLDKAGIKWK